MHRAPLTAGLVTLALAVPAGAAAQPLPDLSQMAVAPADLPPGASIVSEDSLPLPGYLATYYRSFSFSPGAARRAGVKELDSDVELLKTPERASTEFAGDRSLYRNTATGRSYVRFVARLSGMTVRRVHIGAQRKLKLGDGAFVMRATVTTRRGKVGMGFGVVVIDRVVSEVDTIGRARGARLLRQTRAALRATAERVRSGLSPVSVSPPTVSGTAKLGATLHAAPGSWGSFAPPTSFAYQWQRCDAAGGACIALSGATDPDYVIVDNDRSSTLRVAVTASNAMGSTTAVSGPTLAIP